MKALGIKLWEKSVRARTPTLTGTGTVKGGMGTKGKPYWGPPGGGPPEYLEDSTRAFYNLKIVLL